jgi:hypothetical protein
MTLPRTNVVSLNHYRHARDDAQLNADWDRLTRLVDEAWTWRDLETLAALDECIAGLLHRLRKEWNSDEMATPPASPR